MALLQWQALSLVHGCYALLHPSPHTYASSQQCAARCTACFLLPFHWNFNIQIHTLVTTKLCTTVVCFFGIQATSHDQKWVALPQWKALSMARHPVAIPLENCAAEPSVLAASRAKVR
jgi:hypothetical protein